MLVRFASTASMCDMTNWALHGSCKGFARRGTAVADLQQTAAPSARCCQWRRLCASCGDRSAPPAPTRPACRAARGATRPGSRTRGAGRRGGGASPPRPRGRRSRRRPRRPPGREWARRCAAAVPMTALRICLPCLQIIAVAARHSWQIGDDEGLPAPYPAPR